MTTEIGSEKFLKITWGAAAVTIATLSAVVLWLAAVDSKATDAIDRVERQRAAIIDMRNNIQDTRDRTIRIEAIVEELKRRSNNL